MFSPLIKIFKYLVIQVDIAPLADKEWLASMSNNDSWEIVKRAHGTLCLQLLKLHLLDGCYISLQFLIFQVFVVLLKEK